MYLQKKDIKILLLFLVALTTEYLSAQTCVSDYFSISYRGVWTQKINCAVVNANDESLLVGDVSNNSISLADGLITKLTAQGSVLWSKHYIATQYEALRFEGAVSLSDGSFIVIGTANTTDSVTRLIKKQWGVVFKIDAYGKIVWSKAFNNYNELLSTTTLNTIARMDDNNFIIVGNLFSKQSPNNSGGRVHVVMKMDGAGNVKWRTNFASDSGYYAITYRMGIRLVNGGNNLMLGFSLYHAQAIGTGYGRNLEEGYYLLNLNYESGQKISDNVYLYPSVVSFELTSLGPIQHIAELPNGDLSFLFSFSDSLAFNAAPKTKWSANMITSGNGELKKVIGYFNTQYGCYTIDALDASANGEQLVLMDDGSKFILMQIDADGQVKQQKAYASTNDHYSYSSFNAASTGYYIFYNDGIDLHTTKLIKTGKDAAMDCTELPVNMVTEDVSKFFTKSNTNFRFLTGEEILLPVIMDSRNYDLSSTILCYKACCKDTLDVANTKQVILCEGNAYSLPNNYAVKDSGTYYITTTTAAGCDSVSFYHVAIQKNPAELEIGGDPCLEGKDTLVLRTVPGFENYNWMNTITTDTNHFFTRPGIYWVAVSNSCGSKRDSIEVFDKCDFPIYIPSAFTPNNDGKNDVFRVPPSNQNKFIRLQVYNRWGQKIFETTDVSRGWDGTSKIKLQPVGVYVYFLSMETLNGVKITKKGIVTLIR